MNNKPLLTMIREATINDIPQIQVVRNAVKENALSNPNLVTDQDCADFLTQRGKGWVYETNGRVVGFSIADLKAQHIWALFLHPEYEKKGIGKQLHDVMLDWYFMQTAQTVWLGTAPGTRAEAFYRKAGWTETGTHGKGEIRFEMTAEKWNSIKDKGSLPDEGDTA
ncbi:GNAT family N-acetyltransferase [Niabella pedocola]|uniref:GNAT family N-acetyltransferase n=1 Tax=Niabella pedocola TaxID=1752077 RepID=A0ABS8PTT9_9BACT|nr:GNAT family N-acetyltransferase [Niabella pedocola]MCD2424483.1 GNAT family N-acetyltransferase [Niabella pedocola]